MCILQPQTTEPDRPKETWCQSDSNGKFANNETIKKAVLEYLLLNQAKEKQWLTVAAYMLSESYFGDYVNSHYQCGQTNLGCHTSLFVYY